MRKAESPQTAKSRHSGLNLECPFTTQNGLSGSGPITLNAGDAPLMQG
jgi:hypothetical protein